MDFERDEKKRLVDIKTHGFDFLRAEDVLDGTHVVVPSRREGNEPRFLAVGKIDGQYAAAVLYDPRRQIQDHLDQECAS